ncbi:MAG: hypothetical protein KA713_00595 [Chryseotalea sp. WA131a]|nr:MAG: hypothetical protein KA713_00595 [Chryseotalea sp. WA131a]
MKGLIIFTLTIFTLTTYGQGSEKVLYIVDSIPVLKDPDPKEGTLAETDIETLTVVTKKEEIAKHGYNDIDKIIFIITKEFFKRPEEVKRIPTRSKWRGKAENGISPNRLLLILDNSLTIFSMEKNKGTER